VSTNEELLQGESISSSLENREYGRRDPFVLTTQHPLSAEDVTNFANKLLLLGRYNSLTDSGHRVSFGLLFISRGYRIVLRSIQIINLYAESHAVA
jgi:hypothetical protein